LRDLERVRLGRHDSDADARVEVRRFSTAQVSRWATMLHFFQS
jgi:hypothetical protein